MKDRQIDEQLPKPASSADLNHLFEAVSSLEHVTTNELVNNVPNISQVPLSLTRSISVDVNLRESFQRIKIARNVQDMIYMEDLQDAVGPLMRALIIRERSIRFFFTFKLFK